MRRNAQNALAPSAVRRERPATDRLRVAVAAGRGIYTACLASRQSGIVQSPHRATVASVSRDGWGVHFGLFASTAGGTAAAMGVTEGEVMNQLRARVWVKGRVQGVWFRESTRQRAVELGVCGFVRNLPDGRVEALFEGSPEAVRSAVAFVHEGPPHARVTDVALETEEFEAADPESRTFRII